MEREKIKPGQSFISTQNDNLQGENWGWGGDFLKETDSETGGLSKQVKY